MRDYPPFWYYHCCLHPYSHNSPAEASPAAEADSKAADFRVVLVADSRFRTSRKAVRCPVGSPDFREVPMEDSPVAVDSEAVSEVLEWVPSMTLQQPVMM